MKTKVLGRTGISVPVVGLGTAFIGYVPGDSWLDAGEVAIDEQCARETVEAAIGEGATLIDTAPLYGGGRVERVVGEALEAMGARSHPVVVSSKAGRLREGKDYSQSAIRASVLGSLQRLGRESIDIVSVHDAMDEFDEVMRPGGALEALRKLQEEGVVRFIGVGCADPAATARYVATGEFDVAIVANAWSLINQRMRELIIPASEQHGVGLIIGTPLERGLLAIGSSAGEYVGGRTHSGEVLERVRIIEGLCKEYEVSLLAASLQWVTRHPLVASAIPGARSPGEARANAIAGGTEIPELFWTAVDEIGDMPNY